MVCRGVEGEGTAPAKVPSDFLGGWSKYQEAVARSTFLSDICSSELTLEVVPRGTTIPLEKTLLDLVKVGGPLWDGPEVWRTVDPLEVVNVRGPSRGAGSASLLPVPPPLSEAGARRLTLSRFALLTDEGGGLDRPGRTGRWSWGTLLPLACKDRPVFMIVCCCCCRRWLDAEERWGAGGAVRS